MNILICDDVKDEALKLEKAVKNTGFKANIALFEKGSDVLDYLKTGAKIDVCFLDIIMPEMDGIELARRMRCTANYDGKIIFLTTSKDYGPESYQVKAFSYLLKPYIKKDIENILHEIQEIKKSEDKAGLPVTTRNMSKFLFFHEISYIEVMRNTVYFYLSNGEEIGITTALKEILPQLDSRFTRCHRSFTVNLDAIAQIHSKEIILKCGRKLPIARNNKDFDKTYFKRLFGEGNIEP